MNEEIAALLDKLESFVDTDDLEYEMDGIMARIESLGGGPELAPCFLAMMERHPLSDFGCPGAIVHFVERAYGQGKEAQEEYDRMVAASVRRRPALHTLWMLNRITNVSEGKKREGSLALFRDIMENPAWEEPVREQARDYLEYQNSK